MLASEPYNLMQNHRNDCHCCVSALDHLPYYIAPILKCLHWFHIEFFGTTTELNYVD